ncbi:MAG: SusC/RagA family TonB-linked outer membrane protein [Saprospiraceae bacterium]|nr:SusC/RagA family TonB-linked outer membrane protein [Saprospiraceae bacterium]
MKVRLLLFFAMLSTLALAQRRITGTVNDVQGSPLLGASVFEKGNTSNGTITDINGAFEINVPAKTKTLIVSYTGFTTLEVDVPAGSLPMLIALQESSLVLDELLVIGYGSTSKRNLTDNVVKLGTKDISNIAVSNFQSTISGKAAGVRINQTNGKVDGGINIRIRGTSSISAGSEPLYVLDGMPVINVNESNNGAPMNPLLSLSPSEIESIDILKDASSAAIYGARGANGVVLITTKKGKAGNTNVSLNISTGVSSPTHLVEWLNASEYKELFTEAAINSFGEEDGKAEAEGAFDFLSNGTDWQNGAVDTDWNKIAFRDGSQSDIDLSVSGGDLKTQYYFGGALNKTKGILVGNDLKRMSARMNVKHQLNSKVSAGMNLGISKTIIDRVDNDNSFTSPLQSIAQSPLSPAYNDDGSPNANTLYANFLLEDLYASYTTNLRRITGKIFAEYNFTEKFKFNSDLGYDMSDQTEDQYRGTQTPFMSTNGYAYNSSAKSENYIWSNYFTYKNDISDNTNFTVVAGLKASIRRDGSSRFGSNQRYGIFPAVSLGWLVSEESFLKDNSTISFLKIRGSYGQLGNSEIGNFASRTLYNGVSYNKISGIVLTQPGNNDLTWEKSRQLDLGIEFGILKDRLSGEIDFYKKDTDGLLFKVPLPGSSGQTVFNKNIGTLESKGIEIVLNSKNLSSGYTRWSTSVNLANNNNKITSLPNNNADIIVGENINQVGQAVSSFYLVEFAGADPANGDALYYKDGLGSETTNDYSEANRFIAGNPQPTWIAGLTNEVSYKGIALTFTFVGEWGASIYNGGGVYQSSNADFFDNQDKEQLNRWQKAGDITNVPQARLYGQNGTAQSTRYLQKADFIRLRNIMLSYDLPQSITNKIKLGSARLYISGVNLLTFTSYTGYDPEARADASGYGFDNGWNFYSAPQAKTTSVGLNVNF